MGVGTDVLVVQPAKGAPVAAIWRNNSGRFSGHDVIDTLVLLLHGDKLWSQGSYHQWKLMAVFVAPGGVGFPGGCKKKQSGFRQ